jgi:diguanylate cyclase (GGDEF)-like protein/PAS domain S-box-containing protein
LQLGLLTAYFDRKLATLTAREAEALRQREQRHRALIENASDIIAVTDKDGTLTYESSSAGRILGFNTADMVGRRLLDFVHPDRVRELEELLSRVLQRPGHVVLGELAVRDKAGGWREMEVVAKNLLDDPSIGGLVFNLRDITERKLLMEQLEKLSEIDPLTSVLNRRGFMNLAERCFEGSRRAGKPVSVVMIDIDHFKRVNDNYGHAAGDLVLAQVAEQCRDQVREGDVLARYGGEEFVVLLSDGSSEASHMVVDRLRRAIAAARISTIRGDVSVTASFGIATVDSAVQDLETSLRLADEALYEAKRAGRNCIKIRA